MPFTPDSAYIYVPRKYACVNSDSAHICPNEIQASTTVRTVSSMTSYFAHVLNPCIVVVFIQGRRIFEGGVYSQKYGT